MGYGCRMQPQTLFLTSSSASLCAAETCQKPRAGEKGAYEITMTAQRTMGKQTKERHKVGHHSSIATFLLW
ncbi:hypothetical protein BOTBODRAFT_206379 [Botryobasidium botryosum FD-172 SS1]|uniref:Uncharacterized protein n=1 Tax=Botryobasidium botryosum (strain FD-172 SS1) TaxID=930990 RepID=A0A067N3J7_BOTB1|nr:hypothetical protein BOTBODRAFT_206379 [Botryobasidium botryosum FD-172 SS1]